MRAGFPLSGRRAVVVLPHWNADGLAYNSLCRVLNWLGNCRPASKHAIPRHPAARWSSPRGLCRLRQHRPNDRLPCVRVSSTCARALTGSESQGYNRLGIVGTSLGSCYAFISTSPMIHESASRPSTTHQPISPTSSGTDSRLVISARGCEAGIGFRKESSETLFRAVSPMVYFDKFSRWPRKSLIIYAKYDLTFLPEFSRQVVTEFARHHLDHKVVVLPCGHYSMGEFPYNYMDGWQSGQLPSYGV
jgi:hypothetical protein